jgi:hypothetical protein
VTYREILRFDPKPVKSEAEASRRIFDAAFP